MIDAAMSDSVCRCGTYPRMRRCRCCGRARTIPGPDISRPPRFIASAPGSIARASSCGGATPKPFRFTTSTGWKSRPRLTTPHFTRATPGGFTIWHTPCPIWRWPTCRSIFRCGTGPGARSLRPPRFSRANLSSTNWRRRNRPIPLPSGSLFCRATKPFAPAT